jgi:hypothetical protein
MPLQLSLQIGCRGRIPLIKNVVCERNNSTVAAEVSLQMQR